MAAEQQKLYCRAIWYEKDRAEEATIPETWICKKTKTVHWPRIADAGKAIHDYRKPAATWASFELFKVKYTG